MVDHDDTYTTDGAQDIRLFTSNKRGPPHHSTTNPNHALLLGELVGGMRILGGLVRDNDSAADEQNLAGSLTPGLNTGHEYRKCDFTDIAVDGNTYQSRKTPTRLPCVTTYVVKDVSGGGGSPAGVGVGDGRGNLPRYPGFASTRPLRSISA